MISRFLICFNSSWASLSGIPKQRFWKTQHVQRMSAWFRMEESMLRNSLWCEIRYSLDVFHLKKIKWKRPFNVVTLFRLARRARPRHLQPHPNSERQIALNDNESLPSYDKVKFPKNALNDASPLESRNQLNSQGSDFCAVQVATPFNQETHSHDFYQ